MYNLLLYYHQQAHTGFHLTLEQLLHKEYSIVHCTYKAGQILGIFCKQQNARRYTRHNSTQLSIWHPPESWIGSLMSSVAYKESQDKQGHSFKSFSCVRTAPPPSNPRYTTECSRFFLVVVGALWSKMKWYSQLIHINENYRVISPSVKCQLPFLHGWLMEIIDDFK